MTIVDDVARAALNVVGSNAGLLLAIGWASERYRQLTNRTRFRFLRRIGEVVIPEPLDDGTVTCTRGSATVTGNAAAAAAWATQGQNIRGHYFRSRRNWYRIANVVVASASSATLTLDSEFTEDTVTAVAYKIVKRYHTLEPDVRFLGKFVHMRLHRPLTDFALRQLDMEHSSRWIVAGSGPEIVTEIGVDDEGRRIVEFYPFSSKSELVHYVYWPVSPKLVPGSTLPPEVDVEALKSGVLIDVYRFEMAKALRANTVEVGAVWRNEMRAQEKTWEDRIVELAGADRGMDDVSFILHTRGLPTISDNDPLIKTARADAISRLTGWP